jgi:hypothetical protein
MTHQWGGAAVLFRHDIPLTVLQGVSAPDLMVLDLGFCFLVASYLPPRSSNWHTWSDTDPEQLLQEALAYCSASRSKMVLVLGDLNARTASNNSSFPRSQRLSTDIASDSRGNRLLHWCSMYRLSVLNGTTAERDSPGALTCYQERGASMVDYVLLSAAHQTEVRDGAMVVERSPWSDHSHITVTVDLPIEIVCPAISGFLQPPAPQIPFIDSMLDRLASLEVLSASLLTPEILYGPASVGTTHGVSICLPRPQVSGKPTLGQFSVVSGVLVIWVMKFFECQETRMLPELAWLPWFEYCKSLIPLKDSSSIPHLSMLFDPLLSAHQFSVHEDGAVKMLTCYNKVYTSCNYNRRRLSSGGFPPSPAMAT